MQLGSQRRARLRREQVDRLLGQNQFDVGAITDFFHRRAPRVIAQLRMTGEDYQQAAVAVLTGSTDFT